MTTQLTDPNVGDIVIATGRYGRIAGREYEVTRLMPNTIWAKPTEEIPGEEFAEDFVTREIFWETYTRAPS